MIPHEGDSERGAESSWRDTPDSVLEISQTGASHAIVEGLKHPVDEAARQEVWQDFVKRYGPWIERWLKKRGVQSADIDDILQEVYTRTLEAIQHFEHNGRTGAFRCWLKFRARTYLTDAFRARRKGPARGDSALDQLADELENPHSEASEAFGRESKEEMLRQLVASVDSLKTSFRPKTFAAVRRVLLDGCKAKDVAAELGMTAGAVRIARFRAMQELRKLCPSFLE